MLGRYSGIISTCCSAAGQHLFLRSCVGYLLVMPLNYNRRHRRQGHLFQNRFKSILCQEDQYLLELVRYIHLNPLRAGIIGGLKSLGQYPYCGHSRLLGKGESNWQDTDYILRLFDQDCFNGPSAVPEVRWRGGCSREAP